MSSSSSSPTNLVLLFCLAGFGVIAMNIFLPALPTIASDFNTSATLAQYILTAFLATTAIAQLLISPLSDRYGRRPIMLIVSFIFIIGTFVCIIATDIYIFLLGRILQAVSVSFTTISRAIIRDTYPTHRVAGTIGYVAMATAIISTLSPVLGGYGSDLFGWRSISYIILFFSIVSLFLIYFFLHETHTPRSASMTDWIGLLLVRRIWGYLLTSALTAGTFYAFLAVAPFIAIGIDSTITPSDLSLYFIYIVIGYILGNFFAGRFSSRLSVESMMLIGNTFATISIASIPVLMYLFSPSLIYLFYPMVLASFGNAIVLPNTNAGLINMYPHRAGSFSGFGGFVQTSGGAILAMIAGFLFSVFSGGLSLYILMFLCSLFSTFLSFLMYRSRAFV